MDLVDAPNGIIGLETSLALAITAACSSLAFAGPGNGRGNGNGGGNGSGEVEPGDRPGHGNDPDFIPPGLENKPRDPRGVGGGTGMGNGGGDDDGDDDGDDGDDDSDDGDGLRRGSTKVCDGEEPLEGPDGQAGQSHVAHVEFSAVDPVTGEAADGGWARMMYFWIGSEFSFVLNAHQVAPGSAWTLVGLIDGEAGAEAVCFGNATANAGGQLHIKANFDPESNLPADYDPFAEDDSEGEGGEGEADEDEGTIELTLVPTATVDCTTGVVTPSTETTVVLQSDDGIRFVDTDELTCPVEEAPTGG